MMWRRLTANFGWKLLSLGIATALWFLLVGDPEVTTTITVPVQYRKTRADLEVSSDVPHAVQLEVRGPSSRLAMLSPSRTPVVLDLTKEIEPGEKTFTITQDNVQLPDGVSLARALPAQLRLQLEKTLTRDVAVQVRFSGPPPDGYRIARVTTTPDKLRIAGPESHVVRVEFVETDPVQLSSVVSRAEFRVQAYVPDPEVSLVSPLPVSVRVEIEKIPARPVTGR